MYIIAQQLFVVMSHTHTHVRSTTLDLVHKSDVMFLHSSIVIHPDVVGPVEVVIGILMRCGILFEDVQQLCVYVCKKAFCTCIKYSTRTNKHTL